MSYDTVERSNYDAMPISLYLFSIGTAFWAYTSSETIIYQGMYAYQPVPISDSGAMQSGDVSNDDFIITMPAALPFSQLFAGSPPSAEVSVVVRRMNIGENEAPIDFAGQVKSAKRTDQITSEITCKAISASLDRNGLRLSWGRGCPHALYDQNCRLTAGNFAYALQISDVGTDAVYSTSISSFPSDWFTGGYISWVTSLNTIETRGIEAQGSQYFVLIGSTERLIVGNYMSVYPGCDRTIATCYNKFNNHPNYGGFIHMPSKSPFDGDPVF